MRRVLAAVAMSVVLLAGGCSSGSSTPKVTKADEQVAVDNAEARVRIDQTQLAQVSATASACPPNGDSASPCTTLSSQLLASIEQAKKNLSAAESELKAAENQLRKGTTGG